MSYYRRAEMLSNNDSIGNKYQQLAYLAGLSNYMMFNSFSDVLNDTELTYGINYNPSALAYLLNNFTVGSTQTYLTYDSALQNQQTIRNSGHLLYCTDVYIAMENTGTHSGTLVMNADGHEIVNYSYSITAGGNDSSARGESVTVEKVANTFTAIVNNWGGTLNPNSARRYIHYKLISD